MYSLISGQYNTYIICIIAAFILAIATGPLLIPLLTRLKFGQMVRDDGPQSHLKKAGTPTIGGLIILIPTIIVSLFFTKDKDMLLLLFTTLAFGLIGFLDDYIKIVKKRSLGLRAYQKIIGQLIIAVLLAYIASGTDQIGTKLLIPFLKTFADLGVLYIPFTIFVVIGGVNSVNLSDGLDGLAGSITIAVLGFFSVVALSLHNIGIIVFCGSLIGALLGFLRFNSHPAQVFMGDTGSLALGGAVLALAVITKLQIFLLIVGAVYVAEALSVIVQVLYFKKTGKRILKMAPLHHHFELSGWMETKIVSIFTIITIILSLIAILALN